jgi:hypothetical protein
VIRLVEGDLPEGIDLMPVIVQGARSSSRVAAYIDTNIVDETPCPAGACSGLATLGRPTDPSSLTSTGECQVLAPTSSATVDANISRNPEVISVVRVFKGFSLPEWPTMCREAMVTPLTTKLATRRSSLSTGGDAEAIADIDKWLCFLAVAKGFLHKFRFYSRSKSYGNIVGLAEHMPQFVMFLRSEARIVPHLSARMLSCKAAFLHQASLGTLTTALQNFLNAGGDSDMQLFGIAESSLWLNDVFTSYVSNVALNDKNFDKLDVLDRFKTVSKDFVGVGHLMPTSITCFTEMEVTTVIDALTLMFQISEEHLGGECVRVAMPAVDAIDVFLASPAGMMVNRRLASSKLGPLVKAGIAARGQRGAQDEIGDGKLKEGRAHLADPTHVEFQESVHYDDTVLITNMSSIFEMSMIFTLQKAVACFTEALSLWNATRRWEQQGAVNGFVTDFASDAVRLTKACVVVAQSHFAPYDAVEMFFHTDVLDFVGYTEFLGSAERASFQEACESALPVFNVDCTAKLEIAVQQAIEALDREHEAPSRAILVNAMATLQRNFILIAGIKDHFMLVNNLLDSKRADNPTDIFEKRVGDAPEETPFWCCAVDLIKQSNDMKASCRPVSFSDEIKFNDVASFLVLEGQDEKTAAESVLTLPMRVVNSKITTLLSAWLVTNFGQGVTSFAALVVANTFGSPAFSLPQSRSSIRDQLGAFGKSTAVAQPRITAIIKKAVAGDLVALALPADELGAALTDISDKLHEADAELDVSALCRIEAGDGPCWLPRDFFKDIMLMYACCHRLRAIFQYLKTAVFGVSIDVFNADGLLKAEVRKIFAYVAECLGDLAKITSNAPLCASEFPFFLEPSNLLQYVDICKCMQERSQRAIIMHAVKNVAGIAKTLENKGPKWDKLITDSNYHAGLVKRTLVNDSLRRVVKDDVKKLYAAIGSISAAHESWGLSPALDSDACFAEFYDYSQTVAGSLLQTFTVMCAVDIVEVTGPTQSEDADSILTNPQKKETVATSVD